MSSLTRQTSVAVKMSTAAERREAQRAEDERRERERYGKHVEDVLALRRRGFVISREKEGVRVGNKLLSFDELKTMADRERGLAGQAAPVRRVETTASGLKIGDSVALKPKKVAAAPRKAPQQAGQRKLSGAAAQAAEKAREHSADLGTKPRVVWLDLGLLDIDRRYQREIGTAGAAHVSRILRAFNWNCYQPIVVTETKAGRYAVIDGQHRLEAAKKHPLIDSLPCYIIDAPDPAAQAAVFVAVNSRRLGLTSQQKFWAAHAAGDAEAATIYRICWDHSVTILRSPPSGDIPPMSVLAPFTLQKIFRQQGRGPLATTIKVLAQAWLDKPNGFRSPVLAGLARIAAGKEFSARRMTAALAAIEPDKVYADARHDRVINAGALETATERVLRAAYAAAPNGVREGSS